MKGNSEPNTNVKGAEASSNSDKKITWRGMSSLMSHQDFSNSARELITPGKSHKDHNITMKTTLDDIQLAKDIAITYAKFREFGLDEEAEDLDTYLELLQSVGGRGWKSYLMGSIGILSTSFLREDKKGLFLKAKRKQDGDMEES
jgi:hypothetical protein